MIDQILSSMIIDQTMQLVQEYYLHYILLLWVVLSETWIRFVAMCRLHEMKRDGLLSPQRSTTAWYLSWYHLIIFLVLDTTLALLLMIPLLDVPRVWRGEVLTTAFLSRHYNERPAFDVFRIWQPLYNLDMWYSMRVRKPFAAWAGRALLDDVDPSGKHVK